MTQMSEGAIEMMRTIAWDYTEAESPDHRRWQIDDVEGSPVAGEVRALGLLEKRGPGGGRWYLTQAGVDWITASRAKLAS